MIRKSLLIAATVAALSISAAVTVSPHAYAAAPASGPGASAKPVKAPPPKQAPAKASTYEEEHQAAIKALTDFKNQLGSDADISSKLAAIVTETAKLPALEKAYIDAKKAGKEAEAKTAATDYTAAVQKIIDAAVPLDQDILPAHKRMQKDFATPMGKRLKAEKDIAPLLAAIEVAIKPLDDANENIGPLQNAAAKGTQARLKLEKTKIFGEELANGVTNMLEGKRAK